MLPPAVTGSGASVADTVRTGAEVTVVVMAVLQEPEFVYRIEVGTPVAGRDGVQRLTPYQLASRLSYFLTSRPPDDALRAAVAGGSLGSSGGVANAVVAVMAATAAMMDHCGGVSASQDLFKFCAQHLG